MSISAKKFNTIAPTKETLYNACKKRRMVRQRSHLYVVGFYLPPLEDCTIEFIKQLVSGEKKVSTFYLELS